MLENYPEIVPCCAFNGDKAPKTAAAIQPELAGESVSSADRKSIGRLRTAGNERGDASCGPLGNGAAVNSVAIRGGEKKTYGRLKGSQENRLRSPP